MDPYNPDEAGRLFRAAHASYRNQEPFRLISQNLARDHAGSGYGSEEGKRYETVINLMNQMVDAYMMSLVANRPRVLLSTRHQGLKFFAKKFEVNLNNLIEEIRLEETLARWVLDAFFGMGIIKIHLANSAPVLLENGIWMDPGVPYASNIPLDNFVWDNSATSWENIAYAGDWYRIPFDDLKSEVYDQEAVEANKLTPTTKFASDEDRLEKITLGHETDIDEFRPMVDVADFWVPEDAKIYTWAIDPRQPFIGKGQPIAQMTWDGPEGGPYHRLGFGDVPENIMSIAPAAQVSYMAKNINNLLRMQLKRAREFKRVHGYSPSGADDAKQAQRAGDDQWLKMQNPKEIGEITIGGIDPPTQAFILETMNLFDRMAGNLPAMLGLGPQAETLGQEKLIHGAVSSKEAKMQLKVLGGTRQVVRDLGWMLWNDQVRVQQATIPIQGAEGYEIDATWTPDDREGDFFDYNFDIDVYSMAYQSPQQRLQALLGLLQQAFFPAAEMMAAQGGVIDMAELASVCAEYSHQPKLNDIIKFINAPEQEPPSGDLPKKPAITNRTYQHQRVPSAGSQQGQNVAQSQKWMSGEMNPQATGSVGGQS
jgi:hypothetical protein